MPENRLYFLGERNYIQGATVLKFTLESIQKELDTSNLTEFRVCRFKQVREANSLLAILPADRREPVGSLRASISVDIRGQISNYNTIALPEPCTERRLEVSCRQDGYKEYGEGEARAHLGYANDFWDLLREAVQVTKVFHINKYNRDRRFRFVVGGFEQLSYFEPAENESFDIKTRIVQSTAMGSNIYNYMKTSMTSANKEESFLLAFIGKLIS